MGIDAVILLTNIIYEKANNINFNQMKRLLYILALSLNTSLLSAQYEANIWMFGDQIGIDFNSGSPVLLTNTNMKVMEGCSSMCDSEGNLLFYTNGGIISSFLPLDVVTGC